MMPRPSHWTCPVLADDALKVEFAGVGEDLGAVALDALNWMPGGATLEDLAQPAPALGQWQWAHVDAVEPK